MNLRTKTVLNLAAVIALAVGVAGCDKNATPPAETEAAPRAALPAESQPSGILEATPATPPAMPGGDAGDVMGFRPPDQPAQHLGFAMPEGWVEHPPANNMRLVEYVLPAHADDSDPADVVVYYFGQGGAGAVQANLERWKGQMIIAEGTTPTEGTRTVNGMNVRLLDVSGTYLSQMMPGRGEAESKPDWRMLAAIIEAPQGPYYIKMTGPQKTVTAWEQSFDRFVESAGK